MDYNYESFRTRSLVTEESPDDDGSKPVPGLNAATPKERLQGAVRKCIAANRLNKIFSESSLLASPCGAGNEEDDEEGAPQEQSITQHKRNVGDLTIIAFVNSSSGGGKGKLIHADLVKHLGAEHVFDLGQCKKGNMPQDIILPYAKDPNVRILACGGDGTMGWIESSIDKVWENILGKCVAVESTKYKHHLPLAIMPLGTGNDLSRQFGWGGQYTKKMRQREMIEKVASADVAPLDRWRCIILPIEHLDDEAKAWVPRMLSQSSEARDKDDAIYKFEGLFSEECDAALVASKQGSRSGSDGGSDFFDGVFCNYFSIGFDADIAFQFHKEREEHPERFTSSLNNKMIYLQKAPSALKAPLLHDKIRIMISNYEDRIEELTVPKDCRAVVLLNIQSYGGGNRISKKGDSGDGMIEVVFVSNIVRAAVSAALSKAYVSILMFRVAAQSDVVCIRTKTNLHMQVDGEPWLQNQGIIHVQHNSRNALLKKPKRRGGSSWNCACTSGADGQPVET